MNRKVAWLALAAAITSVSCATATRYSGRGNAVQASVGVQEGRLLARPNEVAWAMGERISFESTLDPAELGAFQSNGAVMAGPDTTALPDAVEFVAASELMQRGADGFVVTHYVLDRVDDETLTVRVWGRTLHLDDLGPMDQDRSDLRRILEGLEALGPRTTAAPRNGGFVGLANPALRVPAPALDTPSPARPSGGSKVKVGLEVGTITGLVVDVPNGSEAIDATSLRLSTGIGVAYGQPSLELPTLAYQVEFIDSALVQPTVGASFAITLYAFSSVLPVVHGLLGVEVDPAGPFEAHVGARLGADALSGYVAFTPDVSAGWVW